MSSALGDIQQAIYDVLTGDVSLMSKITGVFDFVDENQAFPYITIGEAIGSDYSTFDRFGESTIATVHIWSRYDGFLEANNILSDVNRLLVRTTLTLTNNMNCGVWYDAVNTVIDPDGLTRHFIAQYRVITLAN